MAMLSWFTLPRVPEPEVMEDSAEVEAYASAAAQAYLDKIDDTFVEHALGLLGGRATGRALDIGTGPGQIVLKLARRPALRDWHFIGVDRSANMIVQARKAAQDAGLTRLSHRDAVEQEGRGGTCPEYSRGNPAVGGTPNSVEFFIADGNRLPFPDASFDLVMSNSVLHHLAQPQRMLAEIARLATPGAAILIRDLRRPSRLAYSLHVRWYGRHYSGLMYKLYCASVRSSYTMRELEELLRQSSLRGASLGPVATVFTHRRTHLGIERALHSSL